MTPLLAPRVSGMSETHPHDARRLGRGILLGLPFLMFGLEFLFLYVTYLVAARFAPHVLGEVAVRPAMFAAWVALVELPMTLAYFLIVSRTGWMAVVTTGETPPLPVRTGWHGRLLRARDRGAPVAVQVAAALIVFTQVADPGEVEIWQLIAVTVAGPFLLPRTVRGVQRLIRWWWRRRPGYQAGHADPPL